MKELGTPPGAGLSSDEVEREIQLTLVNKFKERMEGISTFRISLCTHLIFLHNNRGHIVVHHNPRGDQRASNPSIPWDAATAKRT